LRLAGAQRPFFGRFPMRRARSEQSDSDGAVDGRRASALLVHAFGLTNLRLASEAYCTMAGRYQPTSTHGLAQNPPQISTCVIKVHPFYDRQ